MSTPEERVKATILEIVDNQLKDNTPPETNETYQRLLNQGFSSEEARGLIGAVVGSEIFEVMKKKRSYNQKRFIKALRKLPKMPWE
jgi:hypothetical protein